MPACFMSKSTLASSRASRFIESPAATVPLCRTKPPEDHDPYKDDEDEDEDWLIHVWTSARKDHNSRTQDSR